MLYINMQSVSFKLLHAQRAQSTARVTCNFDLTLNTVLNKLFCMLGCGAIQVSKRVQEPILAYTEATAEVNALQWSASHPEWIAIAFANKMQILHV
jgi:hypothetical protein